MSAEPKPWEPIDEFAPLGDARECKHYRCTACAATVSEKLVYVSFEDGYQPEKVARVAHQGWHERNEDEPYDWVNLP